MPWLKFSRATSMPALISFSSISCELVAGPSVQTIFARLMQLVIRRWVLLFQKRFHAGIVDGAVRLTFRLWDKPHVKPGGRYRVHPIGVVEVDTVERVTLAEVSEADALAGGFTSRAELLAYMTPVAKQPLTPASPVFRVAFRHGGDGDRVPLALEADLSAEALAELTKRVARLEPTGPWVRQVLTLIKKHPRVAASKLALRLGRETLPFKVDVRKLKKLGLTQSFEVGYEVSPRGERFLALSGKRRPVKAMAAQTRARSKTPVRRR